MLAFALLTSGGATFGRTIAGVKIQKLALLTGGQSDTAVTLATGAPCAGAIALAFSGSGDGNAFGGGDSSGGIGAVTFGSRGGAFANSCESPCSSMTASTAAMTASKG